jgi:hypothetical protein
MGRKSEWGHVLFVSKCFLIMEQCSTERQQASRTTYLSKPTPTLLPIAPNPALPRVLPSALSKPKLPVILLPPLVGPCDLMYAPSASPAPIITGGRGGSYFETRCSSSIVAALVAVNQVCTTARTLTKGPPGGWDRYKSSQ